MLLVFVEVAYFSNRGLYNVYIKSDNKSWVVIISVGASQQKSTTDLPERFK